MSNNNSNYDKSTGKCKDKCYINLYDNANVNLTAKAAKYLNKINAETNYFLMCTFKDPVLLRADYVEGDYFSSNVLTIAELHLKMQEQGIEHGFYGDIVGVEV